MAVYNSKHIQHSNELYHYLTININNICRICLEKGPKLMPIFDPIKPPHFSILIMACAAVQVLQGDGLPPYICQKCLSKLNVAFQFKSQCESSDAKLRQCFESFHNLPSTPDLSGFIELKKNDNQGTYENNDGETRTTNNISNIQSEINLNVTEIHDNLIEQSNTHVLQTVQIDSGADTSVFEIHRNNLLELETDFHGSKQDEVKLDETLVLNSKKTKKIKQHQCNVCTKIFRTKPGLVHHIRIHTGERPYICHLCEKRFINGGHLHTHMRTHTGEKNHICAACNKAFATAQQLTKHTIAIHTSERPYGCTYCTKRFASSSNLNTHTKIHTGEKNYHCDQCGKAFSTKGQLYQHMLIHTGEKAYLCEICNKRFSQKAHLVRHLKTHRA